MTVYRVGRKLGRTIYQDEQFIGIMETRELAERVVSALDAWELATETDGEDGSA